MMHSATQPSRRDRLLHELKLYAGLVAYLFVGIGAIELYKVAVLDDYGIRTAPFGFAAVKALVLAKFLMLGEAVRAGSRHGPRRGLFAILYHASALLLVLVVLSVVEEVISGVLHGQALRETIIGLGDRLAERAAAGLLLWLILLPYVALRHLAEALGAETMRRILWGPASTR